MTRKINPIEPAQAAERLAEQRFKFRDLALELGADHAAVLAASEIQVREAVAFKCRVPRCFGYGQSGNCPPHAPKPAEVRELLQDYQYAVFFARRVEPELLKRDRMDKERRAAYRSIFEIVSKVESAAFYDGHYLTTGFAAGSCLSAFCGPDKGCEVLRGGKCRFPLKARPSMEAVGMDVYGLVSRQGWGIYPFGSDAPAEEMPGARLAGVVLLG